VSGEPIENAHKLIVEEQTIMKSVIPVTGLDARILQTSRAMYDDGMPKL